MSDQQAQELLARAREVIRRGEVRLDADCSPSSPLVREIDAYLSARSAEQVERPDEDAWRCGQCGSAKWVSVSLDGGRTRRRQCVPCGAIGERFDSAARLPKRPDEGQATKVRSVGCGPTKRPAQLGITDAMVEAAAEAIFDEVRGAPDFKTWARLREHDYPLGKAHFRGKAKTYLIAALAARPPVEMGAGLSGPPLGPQPPVSENEQ